MSHLINRHLKYKIILFLFLAVSMVSSFCIINIKFTTERMEQLNQVNTTYSNTYKIVYQRYQEIADIYFSGIANKIDLDKKLYDALNSSDNPKKQNEIRNFIYQSTLLRFNQLKRKYLLSINFIFPDDSIFLLMKNPIYFGKPLSEKRHLPRYVNETKKKSSTFETGTFGAAFRFSYPVFYEGEYAGHVEFAFDATAITSSIMKNYPVRSNMFLDEKYFYPEYLKKTKLFKKSHHEGYLFSINIIKELERLSKDNFKNIIPPEETLEKIYQNFKSKTPQTVYNGKDQTTITIIPIVHKITGDTQAVLTIRAKADAIKSVNEFYTFINIANFIIVLVFFSLLYALLENITKKLKIEKEVQEKLIKQQKQLETVTLISNLAYWELDFKTNILTFNDLFYRFLETDAKSEGGYTMSVEKYLEKFVSKEGQKKILKAIEEGFSKDLDYISNFEYDIKTATGQIKIALVNYAMVYDEQRKLVKAYGSIYDITEIKEKEKQLIALNEEKSTLLEEQKSLLALFDKGDSALIKWRNDENFSFEYVSESIKSLLGYDKETLLSNKISHDQLVYEDDYFQALKQIERVIKDKSDFFALKPYRVVTKDGITKWILNYSIAQKDKQGNITHFISNLNDITPIKKTEEKLQKFADIIDEHVLLTSTDLQGNITAVSKAYEKISGYSEEELIGKSHNIVRHKDMPDIAFADMWKTINKDEIWKGEIKNRTKDGGFHWSYTTIVPDFDEDGKKIGYTALRQNITPKKEIEEISLHDDLMGLYNRRHFNTIFENELNRAKRNNAPFFFMMLDVDYFKNYNDTYGHQAGDEALVKIGEVLNNFTKRSGDYGFRLGGEEFGLIAQYEKKEEALAFAQQIREGIEALKISHATSKPSKFITVSIGLVFKILTLEDTTKSIYKACDDALYKAKKEGRNRVALLD